MTRNKPWSIGLAVFGLALIVFAVIWITAIEPRFEKLPTDLDETFTIDATIEVEKPFQDFIELDGTQILIERHQQAIEVDDGVLIIEERVVPTPEIDGILETVVTTMGVDRDSREYVSGYGDREREALWGYPIGVEKQDYILWSDTAGSAPPARYTGEEKIDGLKVYTFVTDEKDINYDFDLGVGLPIPVVMDLIIEEEVEPHTGITVYGKSVRNASVLIEQSLVAMLDNPAILEMAPPELSGLIESLPKEIGSDGIKIPVMTVTQEYSKQTVDEKVSDAKDYKTQLLWATKYGLWIGIGCGIAFFLLGLIGLVRRRRQAGE